MTVRLTARLQSQSGDTHFLKVSRPTVEFDFYKYGGSINDKSPPTGIQIVWPSIAFKTSRRVGLVLPYHSFMQSQEGELDLKDTATAVAKLNIYGQHLRTVLGNSTQQRRLFFLPNLIRRTVMSNRFLKEERAYSLRTVRAIYRYRKAQSSIGKYLCHGDVMRSNVFHHEGTTYFIDFGGHYFAEPGMDLHKIYSGSEERLAILCSAYAKEFGASVPEKNIQLAAVYGRFLKYLRTTSKGGNSDLFRSSLARLETELDTHF